ncbi:hypothetical protein GIB67_018348 [Kingdonia uniflora]|uniref:Uncharacterized protein n=1 Tax=Kingdonia uniflora TaxID=39325 RepID=A0A7J7MJ73_9MAGN|nr:hypothetical protein GIB67_018348 [Kingdonia uniflora]
MGLIESSKYGNEYLYLDTYTSDIGFPVRMHLPIIYETFKDVPNDRILLVVKGLKEYYDISHVTWFDLRKKLKMLGKGISII